MLTKSTQDSRQTGIIAGNVSNDSLFYGKLHCLQYKKGYRFSVDAVLLSHFVNPKSKHKILDLCAGCGVVSLVLCYRWPDVSLTALELQPRLIDLIRKNVELNAFEKRIRIVCGDLKKIKALVPVESFDCVVSNPPYGKLDTGRFNPDDEQAIARHEIMADLDSVIAATAFALRKGGRAAFVYPAKRAVSLIAGLKGAGLEPKRMQIVYSYPGSVGKLVLVEAIKGGGEELKLLEPLYVYKEREGEYSREMAKMFAP